MFYLSSLPILMFLWLFYGMEVDMNMTHWYSDFCILASVCVCVHAAYLFLYTNILFFSSIKFSAVWTWDSVCISACGKWEIERF